MADITDEFMRQMLAQTRTYTAVLLRRTDRYGPDSGAIIWEHGRRNMQLRDAGILCVVMPIRDGGELAGVGIFDASPETTEAIIAADPAVAAGVLSAEVHEASGFPGDHLPA